MGEGMGAFSNPRTIKLRNGKFKVVRGEGEWAHALEGHKRNAHDGKLCIDTCAACREMTKHTARAKRK